MPLGICLITAGLSDPSPIDSLLRQCGISVWTPNSPGADDGHIYESSICVIVDMPGEAGLKTLQLLRDYGVKTPALLVVDPGFQPGSAEMQHAWVLDVIPRTADPRGVLHWVESMCITHKLLERLRASQSAANISSLTA